MNTYLFSKSDMDMNWLAQYDYHQSSGRLIPLYSFWER